MARLNTMSSVRNVFIRASRAFGYQSCIAESFKEPNSEGRIIRNGGTPLCTLKCYIEKDYQICIYTLKKQDDKMS